MLLLATSLLVVQVMVELSSVEHHSTEVLAWAIKTTQFFLPAAEVYKKLLLVWLLPIFLPSGAKSMGIPIKNRGSDIALVTISKVHNVLLWILIPRDRLEDWGLKSWSFWVLWALKFLQLHPNSVQSCGLQCATCIDVQAHHEMASCVLASFQAYFDHIWCF